MFRNIKKFSVTLENIFNKLAFFTNEEKEQFLKIFSEQKNVDPAFKLRLYYLLKDLMRNQRQRFGMIVILGWDNKWLEEYSSVPDSTQNIFNKKVFNVSQASDEEVLKNLGKTVDFDGAILMDNQGHIMASGIYLENMKPKEVAKILHPGKTDDLSEAFGFPHKVHTRHLNSIATSYLLKGTTVYVISEETSSLKVFEKGKIII